MKRISRRGVLTWLASAMPALQLAAANPTGAPITSLTYSPDGTKILAGSQAGVAIHDAQTLKFLERYVAAMDNVHDLRFHPNAKALLIAGGNPGVAGMMERIEWPTRTLQQRIIWHDDIIDSVDFSPDGNRWVAGSADQVCSVFAMSEAKPRVRFVEHSKGVRSVRFLPDGKTIVSGSRDETLRVWEAATGKKQRTLHNHSAGVHALSLRPQPASTLPMLASAAADQTVRLWQPSIGRMVRFVRLDSEPLGIEWSRDGRQLWVACRDGVCRSVDADDITVTASQPLSNVWLNALALAPDRALASGQSIALIAGDSNGQLHRWAAR